MFRSLIHYNLTFMYGVRLEMEFIFSPHTVLHLFQLCLFKRLSFLNRISLVPLWKSVDHIGVGLFLDSSSSSLVYLSILIPLPQR